MLAGATAARLDALVARDQRAARLPSLAVGLVRDGSLAWSGGAGSLDGRTLPAPGPATQYRIGSITKTFVAVAVLRLRDAGRLRLSDSLDWYVPGTEVGDATILQLLTHTAGLRAETDGPWWERSPGREWADLVPGIGRTHPPGQRFHYSNTGFAALGQVLERLHGRPWFDVLDDEILRPLAMTRTSLDPLDDDHARGLAVHPYADLLHREPHTRTGAMAPAGQLWSTVEDLARYSAVLLGEAPEVLSAATAEEMAQPVVAVVEPGAAPTSAWGLGVSLAFEGARAYVGHGGSMPGFVAGWRLDRETGEAVIGLSNATSGMPGVLPYLAALRAEEPLPEPAWRGAASEVDELAGDWWWGTNHHVLRATPDGPVLTVPNGGRGTRLRAGTEEDLQRAAPGNRPRPGERFWVGRDGYFDGEILRVVRAADGRAHHLDLGSFRFTRTPYDPDADLPGGPDPRGWH